MRGLLLVACAACNSGSAASPGSGSAASTPIASGSATSRGSEAPCPVDAPSLGKGLAVERWPLAGDACVDVVRATGFHLRVFHADAKKTAPAWLADDKLVAVTNAGMFHASGAPV